MRAIFGVLSLLVVVAIVGILAKKQLQAVNNIQPATQSDAQGLPAAAPASTVRAQSQQVQQKVLDDVNKALQQGADRNQAAEK